MIKDSKGHKYARSSKLHAYNSNTGRGSFMSEAINKLVDISRSKYSANTFQPTDSHRKAKSAFWSHFFQNGESAPANIDPATAARLSGYNQVLDWWTQVEGFKEWFQNGEEFRQRVEYSSNLALDVIQAALEDPRLNLKDKLQAAKMALEIAAKFPKAQPKEAFTDETISKMDRKQLEEFIQSKIRHLPTVDNESAVKGIDSLD